MILLLAAFGQSLLALANYAAHSALHSHILLIPFVSAYLLYIRRDQLPRKYVADLPLGMVFLAGGLGFFLFTYWLNFAGRALADNYYLVLLTLSFLCCLAAAGFFFFGRGWMRAAAFPLGILRNGFRILVIGLLCVHMGPQMIHSLIHRRGGPVFFVLALIPFFLVLWLLRKGDVHTRQPK